MRGTCGARSPVADVDTKNLFFLRVILWSRCRPNDLPGCCLVALGDWERDGVVVDRPDVVKSPVCLGPELSARPDRQYSVKRHAVVELAGEASVECQ
ncbi:hypothetical protein DPEC_G00200750 [Dallia pectoralis]|uniref:Uncharacterized protein n=1 Tax=Dallia pectoralis TaxID=75939 RepID=A0ACC2G8U6_DALPE|nr:hypothetical protein DPEC_G00200750 [Dallia pectoralis]